MEEKKKNDYSERIAIQLSKELKDEFKKKYNYNVSLFIRNAMEKALEDEKFFWEIFKYEKK